MQEQTEKPGKEEDDDPLHQGDRRAAMQDADVVNLGYILNVIEDPRERTETLRRAYALARRALVVLPLAASAMVLTAFAQPRDAEGRFANSDGKEPASLGAVLRWTERIGRRA